MQLEEIVGRLEEIDQDVNLPNKPEGDINKEYVDKMWPGLIAGITNFLIKEDGRVNYANVKALKSTGYHTFAINRNTKASIPCGRVKTDKGLILIY